MPTTDTDLRDALAPLREVEPTPEEVARVLAAADELRAPRSLGPRRRPARVIAVLVAAAAVVVALAALPGSKSTRPQDAHGILAAAAAVAAEQPAPTRYRYTRVLDRYVYLVNAGDERGRVTFEQTSENWTADAFAGRTVAPRGTATWAAPPSAALSRAAGGAGAIVKAYDGDFRYGDGPLARVPFAAIPDDAAAAGRLLEAAIRDGRWMPHRPSSPPHWAPGVVDSEVSRSAVTLLALGNVTGAQRQALFGVLSSRPGARSLGDVTDAAGRRGVGVALRLPDFGDELRVIIDPKTSDILQSSEVLPAPPATRPKLPAGVPAPPWPPPAELAEHTQVFLRTGSVAALGNRP
ncbi:MAG TPA: hypothetical protein VH834_01255 [Solirubrobacteraceae bacterium]